jgi:hypothetical protein
VAHATEYYKTLFGPGVGNSFDIRHDLWPEGEKVTDQENKDLGRPFEENEVKTALFQMKKTRQQGQMVSP